MYEKFYGLTASPFQLSPDHRFFFESSVHRTALAHLTYGLSQGEGFIIITGEVGAGKTTLVGHLFETLDKQRFVAARVVSTQLQGDDMLRMVAAAFGLPIADTNKATLLRLVESFLLTNQQQGKRCLLVVDEAQNLSVSALEELRMLSNFQSGAHAPLQSFLLGQPQFRAILASPDLEQLRQRVIASYHLGPLAPAETRLYVEHRLRAVGWKQDPRLTDDAYDAIYTATGGVPRRINTLCSRVLLLGFLEENHLLDRSHVERVAEELRRELEFQGASKPTAEPETRPTVAPATAIPAAAPIAMSPTAAATASPGPTQAVETSDVQDDLALEAHSTPAQALDPATADLMAALAARLAVIEQRLAKQDQTLEQHEELLRQALSVATTLLDLGRE
jgi:general secretion pathway protein A